MAEMLNIEVREEFVEKKVKDKVVIDVINSCNKHMKKHGFGKTTSREQDEICGVSD